MGIDGSPRAAYYLYYPSASCQGSPVYVNGSSGANNLKISARVAYYFFMTSQWGLPEDNATANDGINEGVIGSSLTTVSGYHPNNATPCGTGGIPGTNYGHKIVPTTTTVLGLPATITGPLTLGL